MRPASAVTPSKRSGSCICLQSALQLPRLKTSAASCSSRGEPYGQATEPVQEKEKFL